MKKNKKTVLLVLFVLGLFVLSHGNGPPPKKWSGDMSFGLAMTRGNSETLSVSFSFGLKRKSGGTLEWLSSGFYLFNRERGTTSAESMGISSRLNWLVNKRFYSYYELQVLRDVFKDYNFRFLPGAGLGYKLMKAKVFEFTLYGGITHVVTDYISKSETERFNGVKVGDQLTWKLTSTTELNQTAEFVSRLSELEKFLLRFEVGLAAAISKKWSLSISIVNSYDSKPSKINIKKNDTVLFAGVNFKF